MVYNDLPKQLKIVQNQQFFKQNVYSDLRKQLKSVQNQRLFKQKGVQ